MKPTFGLLIWLLVIGCTPESGDAHDHDDVQQTGEHGGRLLEQGEVTVELQIFEDTGTPVFHAWVQRRGERVSPESVELKVTLDRLGGERDVLEFRPLDDRLVSDGAVREPHSFEVGVTLLQAGESYRWQYESLEGRTRILPEMAAEFGLEVATAGPGVINETVQVFGTVTADPARTWLVQARFPGVIRSVAVQAGDRVQPGDTLAEVESDESLKTYGIPAPAGGVIVERLANAGEQTLDRPLFRLVDPDRVWALFKVFPADRSRVRVGQDVAVFNTTGEQVGAGRISWIALETEPDQSVLARVELANDDAQLLPGMHLQGRVTAARHEVDLAVRRNALQRFRDFTVVYRQVGEVYEVRMLTLGRQDEDRVEVLGGLNAGDVYVTRNSYLVKADIDKDSAVHEH